MTDILLGADGDIDLTGARLTLVSGPEELAQRIRLRLGLNRGEDPFDVSQGIPWLPDLAENASPEVLRSLIVSELESCPGVYTIDRVDVTFDRAQRRASVILSVNQGTTEVRL